MYTEPILSAELVADDYKHDPETETVLFGQDLRAGMVVVLKYYFFRDNPSRPLLNKKLTTMHRTQPEKARWCRILSVYEVTVDTVSFRAEYADGTVLDRFYTNTLEWYVKRRSIPLP